ncbi:MAG: FeoA family protein [Bdellovibrionales bacterium]
MTDERIAPLGQLGIGDSGVIAHLDVSVAACAGLDLSELERRLLESGFVEGASLRVVHEGPIGRDPMAVEVDDARVALRRCEAGAVMVRIRSRAAARDGGGKGQLAVCSCAS